eukprot:3147623-Prymnesium_polylepis.1
MLIITPTIAAPAVAKGVYKGRHTACGLVMGLDYSCPMAELTPHACHVKAMRAESTCAGDSHCAGMVIPGTMATFKTDFNWTLGRLVAPETTAQCEEI